MTTIQICVEEAARNIEAASEALDRSWSLDTSEGDDARVECQLQLEKAQRRLRDIRNQLPVLR